MGGRDRLMTSALFMQSRSPVKCVCFLLLWSCWMLSSMVVWTNDDDDDEAFCSSRLVVRLSRMALTRVSLVTSIITLMVGVMVTSSDNLVSW